MDGPGGVGGSSGGGGAGGVGGGAGDNSSGGVGGSSDASGSVGADADTGSTGVEAAASADGSASTSGPDGTNGATGGNTTGGTAGIGNTAADSRTSAEAMAAEPTTTDALASEPTTTDTLSGHQCAVPGPTADETAIDAFHSCTSGVNDRAAIDAAQERTANGGCAALSETAMLCNPVGPEIGEFTVGRPAGFPDYVGPNAPAAHEYTSRASTPGSWPSLQDHMIDRIQENPTPGRNQVTATPQGVHNDAGITPIAGTDTVLSSISTDVQGRTVISNVTVPGQHMLDPGIVSQTAWQDGRRTHAVAVGEGNGRLSIPANPVAEHVFEQKLESDFRVAITRDTRR